MPPRPPSPRLTHFLCIPLVTPTSRPQLQQSLDSFRSHMANVSTLVNPDEVIPEKAIRPVGTLHLTIGVMSLLTTERVESALDLLRSLDLKNLLPISLGGDDSGGGHVSKDREGQEGQEGQEGKSKSSSEELGLSGELSFSVTLRGLASMHAPSKASVLYSAPVDPKKVLQGFCQSLKDRFVAADLLVLDTRPLLLHATILNTIYVPGVRGKGSSGHGKSRAKLTIDAREILEEYMDFEWMKDVRLEKIAICKMGAKKNDDGEEEYVVEGEIEIP